MDEQERLAEEFEHHRPRLRAVAYRLLGSVSEAEDAVQDTWLRLSRVDASEIENLGGWLTTVVARTALNTLRSRRTRGEQPLESYVPDPLVDLGEGSEPEREAERVDSIGLAMLVVLETLSPAERLSFVLHDMFAVPFDDIAAITRRSSDAARQLASRARRRVSGGAPAPDADLAKQREVLDAFLAAAREGDFEALVSVLDPEIVLRADAGPGELSRLVRGAEPVASRAMMWSQRGLTVRPVFVNGGIGTVSYRDGKPFSVTSFTVRDGRVVEMNILADPERLARLGLT